MRLDASEKPEDFETSDCSTMSDDDNYLRVVSFGNDYDSDVSVKMVLNGLYTYFEGAGLNLSKYDHLGQKFCSSSESKAQTFVRHSCPGFFCVFT